ncbi:hypothetical protein MKEN_00048400 [Mycena kentingensis (nom. inval.)]|nr:hypothetical protein MKEN_00048400 [Mycena kentingensis (nom. inval.)]
MQPRSMPLRPGTVRPMGNPAMPGMAPGMNPGMGFPQNMMGGPAGMARRTVSNPPHMGPNPTMLQHQRMQQMMQRQQAEQQLMMNRAAQGGPGPQRPPGQLMGGLPQPGQQFQNAPPRTASPRSHTPVMAGMPPPQRGHPDPMFNEFNNSQNQFQRGQFPFGPSPTPPEQFPPSAPRGAGFPPTPAQQLSMQQGQHGDFSFGVGMPMRPPSQHSPSQSQAQHHHPDAMAHPARPQSQPQQPPQRPLSSSAGPSLTPRLGMQPNNIPRPPPPPQSQTPQQPGPPPPMNQRPQSSGSSHPQPIAPRPPQQGPPQQPGSDGTLLSASASPPDVNTVLTQPVPRPTTEVQALAVGHGLGLVRVMQFSGLLGSDSPQIQRQKLHLSFWDNMIREYFTPKAIMKLTLWRDSMKNEAKPFEIGVPILPRFFLVTTQSGVKSMSFTLDGARERLYAPGHAIIECVTAAWTCRYNNGHVVTLRGPLTVHLVICSPAPGSANTAGSPPFMLKFDDFEFDAHSHDKYIALDAISGSRRAEEPPPTVGLNGLADDDKQWEEPRSILENSPSIPGEPVNAFGIPQATMRCLELAESVAQMSDLISFARENQMGPNAALKSLSDKLREENLAVAPMMNGPGGPNPFFSSSLPAPNHHGTLYSSAPPSVINPPAPPTTLLLNELSPKCAAVCCKLATEAT